MDNKKDQPNSFPTKTKSEFFEILDEVEKYDQEITAMNELFGEAMLSLSSLYFVNPYSSIKSHGYKPTPALLKYNQHQQ